MLGLNRMPLERLHGSYGQPEVPQTTTAQHPCLPRRTNRKESQNVMFGRCLGPRVGGALAGGARQSGPLLGVG